jgi:hypothetical protein
LRIQTALEEQWYSQYMVSAFLPFDTADRYQQPFSLTYISFSQTTLFVKVESYTFPASRHWDNKPFIIRL